MESEKDLDFYVSTPDEHFNCNAQHYYFKFNGRKKPKTEKSYKVFIDALFLAYFFVKQNPSKPFGCVEYIKKIGVAKDFNDTDMLIFMDLLLGIVSNMPDIDDYSKVVIQLVDFRYDLFPFEEDPDFEKDFYDNIRFNVEEIKNVVKGTVEPLQRMKYLTGVYYDFKGSECLMDEIEKEYYKTEGLLEFIIAEIERVEFDLKIREAINTPSTPKKNPLIKIASKRKTDVIKILSAMYDCKMFANVDGKPITNKQDMMEVFGEFFNDDFKAYSTLLTQAKDKERSTFFRPFDQIRDAITNYYELE